MNWKKILKWAVIILVILFVIGILSDNKEGDTLDNISGEDLIVQPSETGSSSSGGVSPDTSPSSTDFGLSQEDLDALENDLNAMQVDDLDGLSSA